MEYGEAISRKAADKAFETARQQLSRGRFDLRQIAAEAVSEAYCVCVVDGEDAAEGRLSPIHAILIDEIETRLEDCIEKEETI